MVFFKVVRHGPFEETIGFSSFRREFCLLLEVVVMDIASTVEEISSNTAKVTKDT